MAKNNINKINVHDILTTKFKHLFKSIFNVDNNKKYGCKIVAIANFILGNCYSNAKNNKIHQWVQRDGTKINLNPNETILTFKTIKQKLNIDTSDEWIRQTILKIQNKGLLTHSKIEGSIYWVFTLSKDILNIFFKQCKLLFLSFKQVYDHQYKKNKLFNIKNNNIDEQPPDEDVYDFDINWD